MGDTTVMDKTIISTNGIDPFDKLPNEILLQIFSYLGIREWTLMQAVSTRWDKFLLFNSLIWTSAELNTIWTPETLCNVLLQVGASSTPISLRLQKFEDDEARNTCLNLIANKSSYKDLFGGIEIRKLVVGKVDNYPPSFIYNSLIREHPNLEVLESFWNVPLLFENRNISLKRLKLRANSDFPSEFLINCLEAFPNLEYLDWQNCDDGLNYNFEIDKFCKAASKSKLKGFAFGNGFISSDGRFAWPKDITALSLRGTTWGKDSPDKGQLEKLKILLIDTDLDVLLFLNHNDVGKNLLFLGIFGINSSDLSIMEDFPEILKRCPNLRFLDLSGISDNDKVDENFINSIITSCPRLEAIYLNGYYLPFEAIMPITKKKGLKLITCNRKYKKCFDFSKKETLGDLIMPKRFEYVYGFFDVIDKVNLVS